MKMLTQVSLPRAVSAALAVFAILLLVLLAWIGGEAHYGNCLEKASIVHAGNEAARSEAVDSCSRWP